MSATLLTQAPPVSVNFEFLHQETARRAFEKWRRDGEPPGRETEYWLEAESDLVALLQTYLDGACQMPSEARTDFLSSILDNALAAISVQDPESRFLFVNRMFESVHGLSRELILGHSEAELNSLEAARDSFSDIGHVGTPESPQNEQEHVARSSAIPECPAVTFILSSRDGSASVTCDLADDGRGRLDFERRLKVLHSIGRLLAGSSAFHQLAHSVLETVGSAYQWEAGTVWCSDMNSKPLQCVATWSVPDEELQEFCRTSSEFRFPLGVGLPGKVLTLERPIWVSDFETEPDLVRRSLMLQCGLKTVFACPVQVQHRVVGVIEFYSRIAQTPTAGFEELALNIGSQIGQFAARCSAERSLLLRKHELSLAKRIQQGWQPRERLKVPGYDIAGVSLPAHEVGGDYFDIFPMAGKRVAIAVGDAAGHGFDSALNIAEVRAYVRALASTESSLQRIFSLVNRHFIEHAEDGTFVTLLLIRLDPATGELAYNNAGHLSGFIFDVSGKVRKTMPSTGFPIGMVNDVPFPCGPSQTLGPGEWALLFTDGIVDACYPDGARLGFEDFLKLAGELCPRRCPRDAIKELVRRVAELTNNEMQDDMTAVLISRHAA